MKKKCIYCGVVFYGHGNARYCVDCRSTARRNIERENTLGLYYAEWLERASAIERRITKLEESFDVIHKWSIDKFREKD